MHRKSQFPKILLGLIFGILGSSQNLAFANNISNQLSQVKTNNCQTKQQQPIFLVFAGGGTREQNEIANVMTA